MIEWQRDERPLFSFLLSLSMMIADTQFILFQALELTFSVFALWEFGLGKMVSWIYA